MFTELVCSGVTFLIAYFTMLMVSGLPLFFLELALGQYAGKGPIKLFGRIAPAFKGLGYGMLMISFLVVIYYNMIIAWTIYYTFAGFASELPWTYCGTTELTHRDCFQRDQASNCSEQDSSATFWNKECTSVEEVCTFSFYPRLEDCYTQDMKSMHENCTGVEKFYNNVNESLSLFINETSGFVGCQNSDGKQFSLNEVKLFISNTHF